MAQTRRFVLQAATSATAVSAAWPASSAGDLDDIGQLSVQADSGVQRLMRERGIVGASACLVIHGQPVWMKTYGETGGAPSRAIGPHTIFSLQSTSKTFCATAVMMAVQDGLVELDTPIAGYIPEFAVGSRLEADPVGKITLRTLLSHHAGFTHEAPVGNNFDPASPSFEAHIESISRTWLRYRVGERHAYSNLGVDLAGYILQRVTGLSYGACLKRWIFDPLGMADSTASPEVYEVNANRAVGHSLGFEHVPLRIPIIPSGGVYSSISDMVKYAQFHLGRGAFGGRQILARPLWEAMHDFCYPINYALGIARADYPLKAKTVSAYTHDGGGFGFGCCFFYAPSEGVAWIVLYNTATGGNPFDAVMPRPIFEARYGPPVLPAPPDEPIVAVPTEALQSRVGLYLNQDSRCRVGLSDGALQFEFDNGWGAGKAGFVGDDEAWFVDGPRRPGKVVFHAARGLEAPAFEHPAGVFWDLADSPLAPPGTVGSEYDPRLGTYHYEIWGKALGVAVLRKAAGHLYFNDIRLEPYRPGLFFSGQGETLDLRGPTPMARNLKLLKMA